jgi:ubiquinone/menaquinone biosynthesis C-methylase UbiE
MKNRNLYDRYILPHIIHCVCQSKAAAGEREKIVPLARGRVLEIGIGSGLNLAYYRPDQVTEVVGIDPAEELWRLHTAKTENLGFPFTYLQASAESIPLESGSIDTVLSTFTLCSIAGLEKALAEIKRVLKPGGRLLFCEHGAAPHRNVLRFQNGLNPAWKRLGGGCNLNRHIPSLLEQNGFIIENLEQRYVIPGWKFASYHFLGIAVATKA